VISPLVAFDEQRNRIGVGGGFYDRTFSFLKEPEQKKSIQLLGFAFELQKLTSIQPQAWDIRLDAVVTETCVYR
ncbi:5-formyltetrahydrofolate cyclo-ligase, partial [Mariniblastus sp.]|nr:5-formyltetrahydrofolate cyclo-ligase [Mariniblastus sp.]